MNDPRKKPNPTTRVAALIVVLVVIVIATLFFNAIKGKRDYERTLSPEPQVTLPAAAESAASTVAASQ